MATMRLPPPPEDGAEYEQQRRLWIGNIDVKITEFVLLKLVQKYGELEKFDFIYHKSGPDKGKPRGYCFVTYQNIKAAETAQKSLNGKRALSKRLVVKKAHEEKYDLPVKPGITSSLHMGGISTSNSDNNSTKSQIEAIESQLRQLEQVKETDIDAFLPADKKQRQNNPLIHCIAGKNDSQNEVKSKLKSHSSSSHKNRDQRSYSKHKR